MPERIFTRTEAIIWLPGEDSIGFWHDIETGFAGRQPLEDTDE